MQLVESSRGVVSRSHQVPVSYDLTNVSCSSSPTLDLQRLSQGVKAGRNAGRNGTKGSLSLLVMYLSEYEPPTNAPTKSLEALYDHNAATIRSSNSNNKSSCFSSVFLVCAL